MSDRYDAPSGGFPGLYGGSPLGPVGSVGSPYLNLDPSLFRNQAPQYIMPDASASSHRARYQLAFGQIGAAVAAGGAFGGVWALGQCMRDVELLQMPLRERKTKILNYSIKYTGKYAQSVGVVACLYSGLGVVLTHLRGTDDELNTVCAGALTGALYQAPVARDEFGNVIKNQTLIHGGTIWRRMAIGSGLGAGISILGVIGWSLYTGNNRLKTLFSS